MITVTFIEGHSIASRLSHAIRTESKRMKSLLLEYNSIVPVEDQLSWEDVTDLSSSIWLTLVLDNSKRAGAWCHNIIIKGITALHYCNSDTKPEQVGSSICAHIFLKLSQIFAFFKYWDYR